MAQDLPKNQRRGLKLDFGGTAFLCNCLVKHLYYREQSHLRVKLVS